jgi:hypothetical protein
MRGLFFSGPDPSFLRQFPKKEERPMPLPFNGFSVFDDKGEVKQMVVRLLQDIAPDVEIESMRKIDYSYVFTLAKFGRSQEVELHRSEIDASWGWRNGNFDDTLEIKIRNAIARL